MLCEQVHHISPVRSSKPNMRLKFCTATPLAPRIKLSSAAITSTLPRTDLHAHIEEVRAGRVLRRRRVRSHPDERLVREVAAVQFDQFRLGHGRVGVA